MFHKSSFGSFITTLSVITRARKIFILFWRCSSVCVWVMLLVLHKFCYFYPQRMHSEGFECLVCVWWVSVFLRRVNLRQQNTGVKWRICWGGGCISGWVGVFLMWGSRVMFAYCVIIFSASRLRRRCCLIGLVSHRQTLRSREFASSTSIAPATIIWVGLSHDVS